MAGGFISNETIDAILNTTDIIATVGEYTKLERRGGNDWWGCCPFQRKKTASFHVDGDKKFYHCFGCHKGGNVVSFVMAKGDTNHDNENINQLLLEKSSFFGHTFPHITPRLFAYSLRFLQDYAKGCPSVPRRGRKDSAIFPLRTARPPWRQ